MKYCKHFLILFFLICFSISGYSQNEVEQLYENSKYDELIPILIKKKENNKLSLREYFLLTKSYGRTKQFSNGLFYAKQMEKECLKQKDTTNLVRAYNLISENLIDMGEIEKGVEFCERVSSVFRKQDSIEFQKLCFKWGVLYYYNKDYQKAYETYNKITVKKFKELSLYANNYALTLIGLEKWDEALKYLDKSIKISYAEDDLRQVNINLTNMAQIYLKQGKLDKAKVFLDSSKNSLTKKSELYNKKFLYSEYFSYYKLRRELNIAAKYLDSIKMINQKEFKKKTDEKLQALETSYEREQKSNEKLVTSRKQNFWWAVISLFVIMTLISLLFLFKYRNIKSAHENVVTEQRLLRSQMTPHFIFNSLSVLQGMILNKEEKNAVNYLSKFSKLLRLILENSREKLVPISKELDAIQNYVDLQNMRNQNRFAYSLTLDENIESLELLIPPMLIQPFIENAIIHGFEKDLKNAKISLEIAFNNKKLVCIIKDNGAGVDENKNKSNMSKTSLSTQITSERLKILSKEYKVESGVTIQNRNLFNKKGTQVKLTIPYKIS